MKNKALLILLMSILVLNLFDGIFTTYWIESEKATEANPLMEVVSNNPVQFMIVKITLVSLSVFLLWRLRNKRPNIILITSSILSMFFFSIFCYHIWAFVNPDKISKKMVEKETIECIK